MKTPAAVVSGGFGRAAALGCRVGSICWLGQVQADKPRWPRTHLAQTNRRGSGARNSGGVRGLWRSSRNLARLATGTCTRCAKFAFVSVLSSRTMLLYGSVRRRPCWAFRKAYHGPLASHLFAVQPRRKNALTCFEGPFGELLRATGPMAKANPFRFSTKYQASVGPHYRHRKAAAPAGPGRRPAQF